MEKELDHYIEAVRKEDKEKIRILTEQNKTMSEKKTDDNEGSKMVHVHMLDSENFVTDWNALGPLPPPPDHDLHSPIVSELMEQWTSDKSARQSLMNWIKKVMNGEETDLIEPLQISSLNHELRDGFTMHVLPLLLRRCDVHVDVKSRAHRQTHYDISVSVQNSSKHGSRIVNNSTLTINSTSPHMMAFKATGGDKDIDATIDAIELPKCTISDEFSKESQKMKSEEKLKEGKNPQNSIMTGALNAVGGLLHRRKTLETDNQRKGDGWKFRSHPNLTPSPSGVCTDLSSSSCSTHEEEQPYHRVVSAPPGKIGITFVQYRGHAMISDVYQDSPLVGWVFPSDILIAIDEVPVSGIRVPEIVRLLTARKERQRALRLISSHAMTELLITQESGALMDG